MSHSMELLHQAFAVILFCFAVSILLFGYRNYMDAFNISKDILKEDIAYEQVYEITKSTVAKGEIIAMLFTPLDYDVEIDGCLISKGEPGKDKPDTYPVKRSAYVKSYEYNSNGSIKKIVFVSAD